MQIVMHAMGKITLFFCAGAIYTATHKTEVSQLDGLGRVMPFTFGAFLIGALSIVGLPPLGGSWSKWYLLAGTADAGQWAMMVVLLISSLLNVVYLLPVAARGFFLSEDSNHPGASRHPSLSKEGNTPDPSLEGSSDIPWTGIREAPLACVVPLCLTALGCVLLFFFADALYALLAPITAR
jgi:multicomponent Na+:H+ antiporter subunit D